MQIPKIAQWLVRGFLLLIVVGLGSNYLIRFYLTSSLKPQSGPHEAPEQKPTNDATFRAALEAGNQTIRDGQYADALDHFLEAERSEPFLTDTQYDALKAARLHLAQIYESASERSATDSVYRALSACAVRQSRARYDRKEYDKAAIRAQDAEELANHLTEGKRDALQDAMYLEVSSLTLLTHYAEAIEAQQRLIDFLNTAADDSDPYFAQAYMTMADLKARAQDWRGFEFALHETIDACDRANSRQQWSGLPIVKNWSEYNLVIAYYREGQLDTAFSKADDFYREYSNTTPDTLHPINVSYHAKDFASLAVEIAREANMPEEEQRWKERGGFGLGSVNVISRLHPDPQ